MDLKTYVPALASAVATIAGTREAPPQDFLEKDVLLHLLLARITGDKRVKGNLVFKGGTCLIKCYLDYPRFSVDLDFAWLDQASWNQRPSKEVRGLSRTARHAARDAIVDATKAMGITDSNVVWSHNSEKLTVEAKYAGLNPGNALVKIQVNFCDPIRHTCIEANAKSLLNGGAPDELMLLDEDLTRMYSAPVKCLVYDPRELVAEKGRAILTRESPKGRDVLDLFLIERDLGIRVEDHIEDVVKKTAYSVSREGRYHAHLNARDTRLAALAEQDISPLLLRPIDLREFHAYRERVIALFGRGEGSVAKLLEAEIASIRREATPR